MTIYEQAVIDAVQEIVEHLVLLMTYSGGSYASITGDRAHRLVNAFNAYKEHKNDEVLTELQELRTDVRNLTLSVITLKRDLDCHKHIR